MSSRLVRRMTAVGLLAAALWSSPCAALSASASSSAALTLIHNVAAPVPPTTSPDATTDATITVPSTPSDAQIADTIISWSGFVLVGFTLLVSVLTLGIAIAGVFGFREIRNARRSLDETQRSVAAQLRETEARASRIDEIVQSVDHRVEEIVRSAYGYNQGQEAYNGGNYNRAADFFSRASALQPTSTAIKYRLGRSYTNLDDAGKAEKEFRKALEVDSDCAEAHRGLALNRRYDDLAEAIEHAKLAIAADRDDPKNWNCLGLLLRDQGEPEQAIDAHNQAQRIEEGSITAFYLALLYVEMKRKELATEYMRLATRDLEQLEFYGRLKPLWTAVLRWAGATFDENQQEAVRWADLAASACNYSERRLLEVRGHMVFLLGALGRRRDIENLPDQIRAVSNKRREASGNSGNHKAESAQADRELP